MRSQFDQAYGRKYMSAPDLPKGNTIALIIESADWGQFEDFDTGKPVDKIVLTFEGDWLPLILTPTNARECAEHLSKDAATWAGRKVNAYRIKLQVKGKVTETIRLDAAGSGIEELENEPGWGTNRE